MLLLNRKKAAGALVEACDDKDPDIAKLAKETLEFRKEMPY
jgi:hypothetical protein